MKLFNVWIEEEDLGSYLVKAEDREHAIAIARQDEDFMRHMTEDKAYNAYEVIFKDTGIQDIGAEYETAYASHLEAD